MFQLARVTDELPGDFERLRSAATADGYRHLDKLSQDWVAGAQRSAGDGEALPAAPQEGELAA